MAERAPIIRINGKLQQMPATDTVPAANVPKNVDGGAAATVYLSTQSIDGGSASG